MDELIRSSGPIGVIIAVLCTAYIRGYVATGRELKYLNDALTHERAEREAERLELRKELSYWRELAWSVSKVADHVVGVLPANQDKI